ncbi:MAG TPA: chemotaxis response regulator protein-glutamate methylesterase [Verrucomicrobiae bacterium]
MSTRRIRTLVVDDSAVVRRVITETLAKEAEIEVVGTAIDPYAAREKILALNPDVLTLDIEMPKMDGITFLRLIMKHRPMPVIVMSSLTTEGSTKALEALQAGAVDVLDKPSGSFSAWADGRLAQKIKAAAQASLHNISSQEAETPVRTIVKAPVISTPRLSGSGSRQLIVMGASTGGTEALKKVLTALPDGLPPICIVQHIPAKFSLAFANRLNDLCPFHVQEAQGGEVLQHGQAVVAPGGYHLLVRWNGNGYITALSEAPPVHHQRPAVDILFDSAVKAGAAPHVLGVLLTGMGADGASGMVNLRQNGAFTIAQNEATCVVFGMPREAIRMGGASAVAGLPEIAGLMVRHCAARREAVLSAG